MAKGGCRRSDGIALLLLDRVSSPPPAERGGGRDFRELRMSETRKHVVAVLFADLSRASGQDAEGDKSAHDVIEYWISRTTELLAQENANLIT